VYDERLIFKVFRRLRPGPNPDVEVTTALAGAGFEQVAAPLIRWSDDDYDLGFGQQFLAGGAEGWALALTSLRDLYNIPGAVPADAGGDFAGEAERLGRVTADMHVALSEVFLPDPSGGRRAWEALVAGLPGRLEEAGRFADTDWAAGAAGLLQRLGDLSDPGPAIRVHGDFHLGQVMRTDTGWFILDFEGEPTKPVEERTMPTSALKDVTSMLRSFHYASRHAIIERALPDWAELEPLARSWESHNRQAFLDGYESNPSIHGLLPDPALAPLVISAFELDKALYELDYERSHRPEWVSIPIDALDRLIHGGSRGAAGT
jgi:maltokinase